LNVIISPTTTTPAFAEFLISEPLRKTLRKSARNLWVLINLYA